MKTEFHYFPGKFKWMKAHSPNKYGDYSTDFYPAAPALPDVLKLKEDRPDGRKGILNEIRKDEDGYNLTIKRPTSKLIRGKIVGYAPPEVLDGSQKLPDGSFPPLRDTLVGNGSDGIIKVVVYGYEHAGKKGSAVRWESARIDNLVPFSPKVDYTEEQEKATRGLGEQPKQPF